MSKNTSFDFNTADWIGGTLTFTRAHKGAYMDVLMAQCNFGHLSLEDIKTILGLDFEIMWESKLKSKFITDENGFFYNKRLEKELVKKNAYKQNRVNNLISTKKTQQHMDDHMGCHMDNDMGDHIEAHMENDISLYNINNINNINNTYKGGMGEKKPRSKKIESPSNEITWRNDFNIYLDQLNAVYKDLVKNENFIREQERFYPNVDIALSIEKSVTNFWGKESGWKHKKKSRTVNIDWKDTLTNAIGLNKVYKPFKSQKQPSRATVSNLLKEIKVHQGNPIELNPQEIDFK